MNKRMDKWMNGYRNEGTDEGANEWVERMNESMNRWIVEQMNAWTDEWMSKDNYEHKYASAPGFGAMSCRYPFMNWGGVLGPCMASAPMRLSGFGVVKCKSPSWFLKGCKASCHLLHITCFSVCARCCHRVRTRQGRTRRSRSQWSQTLTRCSRNPWKRWGLRLRS